MSKKLYCLYYYQHSVYPGKLRLGLQVIRKTHMEKYRFDMSKVLDTTPDVDKLVKFKKWYIANATDHSVEMLHFLWNTFSAE